MTNNKPELESTLTLKSGRVLLYKVWKNVQFDEDYEFSIEFDGISLTIVNKSDCTEDYLEMCDGNSGLEIGQFVVSEYIGTDSQSENWSPDIDSNGLDEQEICEVLMMLDEG